ncbi:MAG: type II toxin-antitoxin system VapC family toxin [Candidatus Aenigmarchaeota archaeon]|nr:type II toxin-antitoxin system VapC family toxin [Candidatus Aenigmarchaeota archaeon]
MYCLDSNIIIDMFRGDNKLKEKINSFEHYCITPIVLCELFKGAYLAEKQEKALKLVEEFVHSTELLEFSGHACKIFGHNYSYLKKKGKQTQERDLMIASIAMANNAMIVTRNIKDFENIPALKIISV